MTCMTTKQKYEVDNPEVVVLKNGKYAYRTECPWKGKGDKPLYSFKFCSQAAYEAYTNCGGTNDEETVDECETETVDECETEGAKSDED